MKFREKNIEVQPKVNDNFDFSLNSVSLTNLDEWHFGTDKKTADRLFDLVKLGRKTATSYLYEENNFHDDTNKYSILTNWDKSSRILLNTISIKVVAFKDVLPEHAYKEGEDDRTIKSWKRIHEKFFTKILQEKGQPFSPDIKVVCEEFKIIKY